MLEYRRELFVQSTSELEPNRASSYLEVKGPVNSSVTVCWTADPFPFILQMLGLVKFDQGLITAGDPPLDGGVDDASNLRQKSIVTHKNDTDEDVKRVCGDRS